MMSLRLVKRLNMFCRKTKDACCAGCGAGEKMLLSPEVESEKTRNSLMSGFPSMVLWISLEACDSAIISVSCELALVAKGTLWVKRTRPAWMPVMAQPAALSVFDPSMKMQRACHPSLEPSQMRCWAIRDFLSGLEQASELMKSLPAKGRDVRHGWWGVFCEWKGSALSVCLLNVAAIWLSGKKLLFDMRSSLGLGKGICLGGIIRCLSRIPHGK